MSEIDLDAIEARANAAHVGKWATSAQQLDENGFMLCPVTCAGCGWDKPHDDATVEFIAHARTDVPALIVRVRELEAAIERVKELSIQHDADTTGDRQIPSSRIRAAINGDRA